MKSGSSSSLCKRDILRALNKFKHRPGKWVIDQAPATNEKPAIVTLGFINAWYRYRQLLSVQAPTLKLARKTLYTSVAYNWQEVLNAYISPVRNK